MKGLQQPQTIPPEEWLSAFVPLGLTRDEAWSPAGAGTLLIDPPVLWLLTAKSLVESAGEERIAGLVRREDGATLVDLTTGRRGSELDWLPHPEHDLAAIVFPVDASWKLKAFAEQRCFPSRDLQPLQPAATVGCPYGLGADTEPFPVVLSGAIAAVEPNRVQVLATAPLLPRNAGAPLLIPLPSQAGGGVALAGITTATLCVPESHQSNAPPVRITKAVAVSQALALIRSDGGKAMREAAVGKGQAPEA